VVGVEIGVATVETGVSGTAASTRTCSCGGAGVAGGFGLDCGFATGAFGCLAGVVTRGTVSGFPAERVSGVVAACSSGRRAIGVDRGATAGRAVTSRGA